jgi:hypothetical protein
MPAYSFNERFVPMVLDGTKRQTIRARRKNPAKVGDTLYLLSGLRTRNCKRLREETCKATTTIVITKFNLLLFARRLTDEEYEIFKGYDINNKIEYQSTFYRILPSVTFMNIRDSFSKDLLAWNDGFRPHGTSFFNMQGCYEVMNRYFSQTHELPLIGDIIYW